MKLLLTRHATATDHFNSTVKHDFDRYLIDSGKKEAETVARALHKLGVRPDAFVSSPLVRARQTAEIMAEVFGHGCHPIICEALAPGGRFSDLYKELMSLKRANEVMLFGHEPDISRLAATLLHAGGDFEMPFKKAGVARIDVFDLPPTSPGILKWFITPKIAQYIVHS